MRRRHGKGNWWVASGGGAECDVTREEAALRELVEETGSTDVELGPVLWQRDLLLPFAGRRWDQDEWYELARTTRTATAPVNSTELDQEQSRRSVLVDVPGTHRGT